MYKIKLKTRMMGPGISHAPGDIIDVENIIGRYLIESRQAELISQSEIETAMIQPPENAMMPKPIARKPTRKPGRR